MSVMCNISMGIQECILPTKTFPIVLTEESPEAPDSQSKYSGLPVQGVWTLSIMY